MPTFEQSVDAREILRSPSPREVRVPFQGARGLARWRSHPSCVRASLAARAQDLSSGGLWLRACRRAYRPGGRVEIPRVPVETPVSGVRFLCHRVLQGSGELLSEAAQESTRSSMLLRASLLQHMVRLRAVTLVRACARASTLVHVRVPVFPVLLLMVKCLCLCPCAR